jgi:hypothetical protein
MGLFYVFLLLNLFSSLFGNPRSQTMAYVCVLLGQKLLSPGLCFSIFTTLVQVLALGHAPTTVPSIQYAPIVISMSVSTPPTALRNSGWRSRDLTVLPGVGGGIRNLINHTQVFNPDKP